MKDKDNVFGNLHAKELSVGDIVEWSSWCDSKETWIQNYGELLKLKVNLDIID